MEAALYATEPREQAAADTALEALYVGSATAQAAAAHALAEAGPGPGGDVLAAALASTDAELSSRAASVLSHVVLANAEARAQLAEAAGGQLAHCTHQLAGLLLSPQLRDLSREQLPPAQRAQALRFVRLAVAWLPGCGAAVLAFLQAATARPFLVGVVSGTQCADPALRGLVAALLGLCATVPRPPAPAASVPTPGMLRDVILAQIGLDVFAGLLGGLRAHLRPGGGGGGRALAGPAPPGAPVPVPPSFYAYALALAAEVSQALTGQPIAAPSALPPPPQPVGQQPGQLYNPPGGASAPPPPPPQLLRPDFPPNSAVPQLRPPFQPGSSALPQQPSAPSGSAMLPQPLPGAGGMLHQPGRYPSGPQPAPPTPPYSPAGRSIPLGRGGPGNGYPLPGEAPAAGYVDRRLSGRACLLVLMFALACLEEQGTL